MSEDAGVSRKPLERLHDVLVESLTHVLSEGLPIRETERSTGKVTEIGRAPAPAPYILAAVRLLKENGVRAIEPQSDLVNAELRELPTFGDDDSGEPLADCDEFEDTLDADEPTAI